MTAIALTVAVVAVLFAVSACAVAQNATKRVDQIALAVIKAKALADANAEAMNQNFQNVATMLEGLDVLNSDAKLKARLQPAPERVQ